MTLTFIGLGILNCSQQDMDSWMIPMMMSVSHTTEIS